MRSDDMEHLCFIKQISNEEECWCNLDKKPKSMPKFKEYLLSIGYEFRNIISNKEWFEMDFHFTPSEKFIHIDYEKTPLKVKPKKAKKRKKYRKSA
jgi:hypothetical protein